jgi:hypothetical protein
MSKVTLLRERHCDWYMRKSKRVAKMLPFYEREGKGYVHRVRSATHHYDYDTGELRHTSVSFWCGLGGFLDPAGREGKTRRNPAKVCSTPSPGRVVCATCEGRAIGAGQVEGNKIGDHFVKFRPHAEFMNLTRPCKGEV